MLSRQVQPAARRALLQSTTTAAAPARSLSSVAARSSSPKFAAALASSSARRAFAPAATSFTAVRMSSHAASGESTVSGRGAARLASCGRRGRLLGVFSPGFLGPPEPPDREDLAGFRAERPRVL